MRLRCARCGCYVRVYSQFYNPYFDEWSVAEGAQVQPCARCLREAQRFTVAKRLAAAAAGFYVAHKFYEKE